MNKDEWILAVLDTELAMSQGAVTQAARMDNSIGRLVLGHLVAAGLVTKEIARTGKQGRPAYLYRRVRTEVA